MNFQIRIANLVIQIQTTHDRTWRLCRDYLCENQTPDFSIVISEEDIRREREMFQKNRRMRNDKPVNYSDGYLETLIVYRRIAEQSPEHNTFLMHGSVVTYPTEQGDCAVMFTARSGVGKTTRTYMWLKQVPGSYAVNGDKPLLHVTETEVFACGTPWAGKEQMQTNCMIPLKTVFFLERAEENSLEEISMSAAFPYLLQQFFKPNTTEQMVQTLNLVHCLSEHVKFYRFRSNLEEECIELAYQAAIATNI